MPHGQLPLLVAQSAVGAAARQIRSGDPSERHAVDEERAAEVLAVAVDTAVGGDEVPAVRDVAGGCVEGVWRRFVVGPQSRGADGVHGCARENQNDEQTPDDDTDTTQPDVHGPPPVSGGVPAGSRSPQLKLTLRKDERFPSIGTPTAILTELPANTGTLTDARNSV